MPKKKPTPKCKYTDLFGLPRTNFIDKKICRERIKILKEGIKNKKWKGKLSERAEYYLRWHQNRYEDLKAS